MDGPDPLGEFGIRPGTLLACRGSFELGVVGRTVGSTVLHLRFTSTVAEWPTTNWNRPPCASHQRTTWPAAGECPAQCWAWSSQPPAHAHEPRAGRSSARTSHQPVPKTIRRSLRGQRAGRQRRVGGGLPTSPRDHEPAPQPAAHDAVVLVEPRIVASQVDSYKSTARRRNSSGDFFLALMPRSLASPADAGFSVAKNRGQAPRRLSMTSFQSRPHGPSELGVRGRTGRAWRNAIGDRPRGR